MRETRETRGGWSICAGNVRRLLKGRGFHAIIEGLGLLMGLAKI